MATFKTMAANFAAFLVSLVCVSVVLTSCSASEKDLHVMGDPGTVEVPVPYIVMQDRMVPVLKNVYYDGEVMTVNNTIGLRANVEHTLPTIEMAASEHAAATVISDNGEELHDSNGQITREELTITPSRDGSYEISATLTPDENNYSTIKSLHPKVSLITTRHNLNGFVTVKADESQESSDFSFKMNRSYLLVDPSVDTEIINHTDTLIKVEVKVDTLVNTVIVRDTLINNVIQHDTTVVTNTVVMKDTITITVDKFIKGADIRQSVVNDLGFSQGTLTLGDTQLLKIMLRHKEPVINVEKDKLGNVNFTPSFELQWLGDDGQETNGSKDAYNVTIKSFSFVRCEYVKVTDNMYIVRTIYSVTGSFYNENNDLCEFTMELAPSYMQKYDEVIIVPETVTYRGIIRSLSVDGLKLMTKPVLQVWNKETNSWEDVNTFKRCCVGMSGSPSGLDLFVKDTKVIEETENSWWYSGEDATWTGPETKSDGVVVTKKTKVYQFDHMFPADAVADGKVGPATQLYIMRAEMIQIPDPDGKMLVCTWEDGSEFSLNINVVLNNTEFIEKAEMVGQTRTESDKTYKYATSFVQHFSSSIGGQKLQDVDATSTLWLPVE